MEIQMGLVLAEIACVAGRQGLQEYMKHRERLISENREDELISSQIKKYSNNIYNRMTSRDNTPIPAIIQDLEPYALDFIENDVIPPVEEFIEKEFRISDIHIDEEKSEDEKPDQTIKMRTSLFKENKISMLKKLFKAKSREPTPQKQAVPPPVLKSARERNHEPVKTMSIEEIEQALTRFIEFLKHEEPPVIPRRG
jgi:hypothetical protein